MKRRHFIHTASRWLIGTSLLGGGVALMVKRRDKACILDVPYCKDCRIVSNCSRPQALLFKQFKKKQDGQG